MEGTGGNRKNSGSGGAGSRQLDSEWNYQAQFRALAGSAPDDLTFREASVQDVSDRGREEGAARLKRAFQEVFPCPPLGEESPPAKRLALTDRDHAQLPGEGGGGSVQLPAQREAEVRRMVQSLVRQVQLLRQGAEKPDQNRDSEIVSVMRQLEALPVSVGCLKATKVAAELNSPCWRAGGFAPGVQALAASLVRKWRAMYKAENPNARPSRSPQVMSDAAWALKCQNVSMDLEQAIHGLQQKSDRYCEMVSLLCRLLLVEREACRGLLLEGATRAKKLAERANDVLRHRRRGTVERSWK